MEKLCNHKEYEKSCLICVESQVSPATEFKDRLGFLKQDMISNPDSNHIHSWNRLKWHCPELEDLLTRYLEGRIL